ncbi:TPX2 [Macleaya cordata]|uniref:TPX2 n=1 Tax=Macleaya cordata TaxID=56857 RepID=A0A200PRC5_MACCD|nr:TPX2 [Macleaya cordata]
MTPVKSPLSSRSQISENFNPNQSTGSSPIQKSKNSPTVKSEKSKKSAPKSLNQIVSPRNKIQERKFVVAKKNPKKPSSSSSAITCKCKDKMENENLKKCPCIAYQTLRASQEDFFRNRSNSLPDVQESDEPKNSIIAQIEEEEEKKLMNFINGDYEAEDGSGGKTLENNGSSLNSPIIQDSEEIEVSSEMGSSKIKRRRDKVLEEARSSVPETGSGKVMHLVQAFEKLLTIPSSKGSKEKEEGEAKDEEKEESKKGMRWALPGLRPPKVPETETSSSSFPPSEMFFKSGSFDIGSSVSSSFDSSQGSFTSRTSAGGRRSRRNSSDSGISGIRRWKKQQQLKVTSQKPFKLRTELRGRMKEEEFVKKVQEMLTEEEKLRIPVAQGLPWTTDEPEFLVKPPVKESTRPLDLKLNSDVRAVERAEFDHHVAEKLSLIEQYRLERDRQQKLEEEEEIKRLRKELVPRAQPMPYFDRPFIPKRSVKHPTIPKEPKFHIPHHKKIKCMSWNDMNIYTQHH